VLKLVKLDQSKRKPHQLRAAQRQRVALAPPIAKRPKGSADEPLRALDKKCARKPSRILNDLKQDLD